MQICTFFRSQVLGFVLFSAVGSTLAAGVDLTLAEALELRRTLEQRIAEIRQNPRNFKKMMQEGSNRTVLCRTCHGQDGIAVKEQTPNLAGQNPVYIVDQFRRFGDGRRYDFLMSGLAKSFSDEDMIKIALYYANLPMRPSGGGRVELRPRGEALFTRVCTECHGTDGRGREGYALLAGQRPDYVVKMLKEFRDRTGRRTNPWMTGVAIKLNDEEIEALAAYIASLN